LAGDRVYVVGGSDGYSALSTVESRSVHGGPWRSEKRMLQARHLAAVVAVGTRIYAIGGHTGPGEEPEDNNKEHQVCDPTPYTLNPYHSHFVRRGSDCLNPKP